MTAAQSIQHFSTTTVPSGMRFDYWMSILRQSLWPVTDWTVPRDFNVELREAQLGCLTSMTETISASDAYRTPRDVKNTGEACYLLFANRRPWFVEHGDHCERYAPGEVVLVDCHGELKTSAPSGFDGIILKLPADWVNSWLPEPDLLVGRRIARDSKWGQVFSPIICQITPETAVAPPLAPAVMVDQIGAVLALIAGEKQGPGMSDLLKRVQTCIHERCSDPHLAADHVAASLNVPPRLVHRALAANDLTFASQLRDARIDAALAMLTSPSFTQLTTIEIARQAGFLSASHFARVVRKRTGHTPPQLRRMVH